MYILGISCYYHDSAAVILKDGVVIAAADEERFSRKKHDASFPKLAIEFCLTKAGITSRELDYVVFYEKPFLKFERMFLSTLAHSPKTLSLFKESMKEWFFDKLWIKSHILSALDIPSSKLLFSEHHLSHLASAFFCSSYEKAAVLSIDGVGEWTTASWGVGNGNNLEIKEEIRFPQSLGLLYSTFTVFAGFEANEGEYKVMGLAPYGKPRYKDKIRQLLDIKEDGSFQMDLSYFSYHHDLKGVYTQKFLELFGQPNQKPDEVQEYYADIAASIQAVLEDIIIAMTKYIKKRTNLDKLCYAGGVALNSKANWLILKKSGFKELYIQPSAGDSGGALGAALWAYHAVLNNNRVFTMDSAYYGAGETDAQIKRFLDSSKIPYKKIEGEKLITTVVDAMVKGKVIGWLQGDFEWGPRALGNRSILADPRSFEMKHTVNSKIKFREGFRPFAPSAILERSDEFFEVGRLKNHLPFSFMLYVVPVKKEKSKDLAAITHEDGTARPQFVRKEVNPLYHRLIEHFGERTGIPVILNTSFNLKGEPIVNTAEEAYSTFKRSGIDMLVLHNFVITKK